MRLDLPEVRPFPPYFLEQAQQDVCVKATLMCFVDHEDGIPREERVQHRLTNKHAIRQELDTRAAGVCAVVKPHGIANLHGGRDMPQGSELVVHDNGRATCFRHAPARQ